MAKYKIPSQWRGLSIFIFRPGRRPVGVDQIGSVKIGKEQFYATFKRRGFWCFRWWKLVNIGEQVDGE